MLALYSTMMADYVSSSRKIEGPEDGLGGVFK